MNTKGGEKMKIKPEKFNESLSFSVVEGSADEEKRTVRVCALRACLSKNNRYYSPKIVESVAGTLKGKGSYADHDERDTKNLIGRIVGESFESGKLYADIKISKAKGISSQTWEKINDGTITDVSIAADGKAQPKKMGENIVAEVTELKVHSVDFVTEGGVKGAKVIQVFEDLETIPELSEVKKKMESVKQFREEYPILAKEIDDAHEVKLAEAVKRADEAEHKLIAKEVADHKETRISELSLSDKLKDVLRKRVIGETKEATDESLKGEVELLKTLGEAFEKPAEIKGIVSSEKLEEKNKKKEPTEWNSAMIRASESIPENFKGDACTMLWDKGSEKMVEWLKDHGVEI